ncbi:MAG: pyruvate dehydrogenase, partial [Roseomonas sp.]|nr:pyruvate dehydrogenase [Roseomonas sp.]
HPCLIGHHGQARRRRLDEGRYRQLGRSRRPLHLRGRRPAGDENAQRLWLRPLHRRRRRAVHADRGLGPGHRIPPHRAGGAAYDRAIGVVLGGDASVATNGFWSALTIATTQKLPVLFYIEDNGYGISTPSTFQTPGADIAANLASFANLHVLSGDGTDPATAGMAGGRGAGPCARPPGPLPAAPDGATPARPQLPGYPDL